MCVIYFAFDQHSDHPLILLANRDEFYDRPSQAARFWDDLPHIYGGRDLVGGGTWLGVTKEGRFAAVTNYRDPSAPIGTLSRGNLVADFLRSNSSTERYLETVKVASNEYSGFNLIAGELSRDRRELFYYSNRGNDVQKLDPGIYGLSNHLLDTPWPKVAEGKARFANLLSDGELSRPKLFEILANESLADDKDLPSTGVPYETEKAISAVFIKTPGYGTRCSTVLTFDNDLDWNFEEQVFV
jgi:uncharacterized protein with NRDE domain